MPVRKSTSFAILFACLLPSCSLPRIVVLHDPLSADEHVKLAQIYDAQEKPELAREQYQAAVKADPRHGRAWLLLGDLSFRMQDFTTARTAYEKATTLEPGNGDAHNNLAWVHLQSPGDPETARQLALKALSLTPDHRPFYLDTLGVALHRLGKLPEAIAALRESIAALLSDKPELAAEAYGHLAEAYKTAGKEKESGEAANRKDELLKRSK